jgi:predicted branched-subunit amino acid permease
MGKRKEIKKSSLCSISAPIPILAGFLFLGIAYGIYMNVSGFSPVYSILRGTRLGSDTVISHLSRERKSMI